MEIVNSVDLGDQTTSDITIRLINEQGTPQNFHSHSSILIKKSKFFADKLSNQSSSTTIDHRCSNLNYDHHVKFLKSLYLSNETLLDNWESVQTVLGVLDVAYDFKSDDIIKSCLEYLEAVPWEDKEEEQILKTVSKLGQISIPVLARIQPVNLAATKNVFISAVRFATSITAPVPPFKDELKTSAQEQVEYMLGDDEDLPLIITDDEVKSETQLGISKIFNLFEETLKTLVLDSEDSSLMTQSLSDLEWLCNILPKMDLMKDFVTNWVSLSSNILTSIDDKKLESVMWVFKLKIIELTGKVLDAVGYGSVIVSSHFRVNLVKIWLPYIGKMKLILDSIGNDETGFPYKMDEDLCQNLEGAIVSLILALPSNDQAEILAEWMSKDHTRKFPDLSEAFEVWCYRTKSAKRRLVEGLERVGPSSGQTPVEI
jgi:hypothetical protein